MDTPDDTLQEFDTDGALRRLEEKLPVGVDLAALYLGLSRKALDELRAGGEGPTFVVTTDRGPGGTQMVTYSMGELRKWRASTPVSVGPSDRYRRGLAGWVMGTEPFWMDSAGLVIAPALDHDEPHWVGSFLRALAGELGVEWMTPRDAMGRRWKHVEIHSDLVHQFNSVLDAERFAAFAALEATEIATELASAAAPL